jgi:hypothetical protein
MRHLPLAMARPILALFSSVQPTHLLKSNNYLALFRKKNLAPPTQIDVKKRRHVFALAPTLQTLQLFHGAIELPVNVSFLAQ